MKYAISSGARHLVGRLDKNDDFIEALEDVCNKEHIRAGFFTAVGVLSAAELQLFDSREYVTRFDVRHDARPAGPQTFEIVSLTGHIATVGNRAIVRAEASLSYLSHGGQMHMVGGLLRRSKIVMCEYHITFFQDIQMKCSPSPGTNLIQIDFNTIVPGASGGARGARAAADLYAEPASTPAGSPAAATPWHVAAEPRRMPEVFTVGNRSGSPSDDAAPEPTEQPEPQTSAAPNTSTSDITAEAAPPAAVVAAVAATVASSPAAPAPVETATAAPEPAPAPKPAPEPAPAPAPKPAPEPAPAPAVVHVSTFTPAPAHAEPAPVPVAAPAEPPPPPPPPASAEQWQAAIMLANPSPEPAEIKVGDVLRHPRFNDCLVLKFETPRVVLVQQIEGQATHRFNLDDHSQRHLRRDGDRDLFKIKPLPSGVAALAPGMPLPPDNGSGLRVRPRPGSRRVPDEDLEQFPTTNDIVDHPKWGLCNVTFSDEDKDIVELRPRQGSNTAPRPVALKTFNIIFSRLEGDQKVLRLEPRTTRPNNR